MHLSQRKLSARPLALELEFRLDFHRVTWPWRATLTNGSDVKYTFLCVVVWLFLCSFSHSSSSNWVMFRFVCFRTSGGQTKQKWSNCSIYVLFALVPHFVQYACSRIPNQGHHLGNTGILWRKKTNSFSFSPLPSGMAEPGFNYPHNSTMTCFCIDSAPAERRGHRTNGAVWSERHQKDQPGGWGPDRGDQERECQCRVSGEQRGDATNRQPRLHMRVLMRHFMPFRDCKPCDATRSLFHPSRHDHIFVESGNVSVPKNI